MSEQGRYAPLVVPGPATTLRSPPAILLDRAMRGQITTTPAASDYGYATLNNDAQQVFFIVVRNVEWGPAAVGPASLNYINTLATGGPAGVTVAFLPDRGKLPGYLEKNNLVAAPAGDYVLFNQSIGVSTGSAFPIAVLPPGWALRVAAGVVDVALTVSFLWEVLTPDEFAQFYGASLL